MFLLDKPYVSDFLKKTLREEEIPVVHTQTASRFGLYDGTKLVDEQVAAEIIGEDGRSPLYMTSENAIQWAALNLNPEGIPAAIRMFKNKAEFRKLTKEIFPDFHFREVSLGNLRDFRCSSFPLPFVVKPSVGFFSMGVYQVTDCSAWDGIVDSIFREINETKGIYPGEVLNTGNFLIEQCAYSVENGHLFRK